jgi:hypothetical protein
MSRHPRQVRDQIGLQVNLRQAAGHDQGRACEHQGDHDEPPLIPRTALSLGCNAFRN